MSTIHCSCCGKSVSTPVPDDTVARAYVECPECMQAHALDAAKDLDIQAAVKAEYEGCDD